MGRGAPDEFVEEVKALANTHHEKAFLDIMRAYHFVSALSDVLAARLLSNLCASAPLPVPIKECAVVRVCPCYERPRTAHVLPNSACKRALSPAGAGGAVHSGDGGGDACRHDRGRIP